MTDEPRPVRLFVAASVPDVELKELEERARPLRERLIGARWAPLSNQHITLKFLGSTPVDKLSEVERVVGDVSARHRRTDLSVTDLGCFPNPRRARVLWAGIRDDAGVLTSLAADMAEELEPLGFRREKRAFTPHLTLARFRYPVPVDETFLQVGEGNEFPLEEIDLFRSHLSPKGARYEVLKSFSLAPSS